MMDVIQVSPALLWWVSVIDIPAMSGLLWFVLRTRREAGQAIDVMQSNLDHRSDQLKDALNSFKLEVAKHYASQGDLRDLETRLVAHLLRTESKLDATALKAEAASHKK